MTAPIYYTVDSVSFIEIEPIKKSRFIAHLYPLNHANQISTHVSSLKQKYPNANHHCWAYHLFTDHQVRFSDDGEPTGSAGKPILAHLSGKQLTDVTLIVSRIFGGTKLGVGGLVRAYSQAAGSIIDHAPLIPFTLTKPFCFCYHYEDTALVEHALHSLKLTPNQTSFDHQVMTNIDIPHSEYETILQSLIEMTQNRIIFMK